MPEISIAFIAGLHDLGKCSPPFTFRGHNEKGKQTERLLNLYRNEPIWSDTAEKSREAPHGFITAIELPEILRNKYGFNKKISEQIGILIGGHHGIFPNSDWRKNGKKAIPHNIGNKPWEKARNDLAETLAELLEVEPMVQVENAKLDNATVMILAGLVSVADWIGSASEYFECAVEDSFAEEIKLIQGDLEHYLEHAEIQAEKALKELGWIARKERKLTETNR